MPGGVLGSDQLGDFLLGDGGSGVTNLSVTAVALVVSASVPVPTLRMSQNAVALTVTSSVPVPTIRVTQNAVALLINVSVSVPTVVGATAVTAPALVVTSSLPAPTIVQSLRATALSLALSIPPPTLPRSITATSLTVTTSVPVPIIVRSLATPSLVVVTTLPAPSVFSSLRAPALSLGVTLPPPTIIFNSFVSAVPLSLNFSIPVPQVQVTGSTASRSFRVDGVELNDGVNFVTFIPQLENLGDWDVVLVDIDGDYPHFVRLQPREQTYSIMITMTPCNWATYNSRLNLLKSIFTTGSVHELEVQARGMPSPKTMNIVVTNMLVDPKQRLVAIQTTAARPVLA